MAIPLRVTMFFDDGATGWSEQHYDLTAQSLQEAVSRSIQFLLPARINLLAAGPWLKYVRASFDNVFRDSQVFFTNTPPIVGGGHTTPGQFGNNPNWLNVQSAVQWTTALLRGVGGDLYRSLFYISGVPYLDPTDIGSPQMDPVLVQAFQQYRQTLINNNYGFKVWQRDTNTFPYKPITQITANLDGTYNFTVPAHGFLPSPSVSQPVRAFLYGMKFQYTQRPAGRAYTGGTHIYQVVDAQTLKIFGWTQPPNSTFVSGNVQNQQVTVVKYADVLLERFTHRKRGRPFDSPRGRSSRRRTSLVA